MRISLILKGTDFDDPADKLAFDHIKDVKKLHLELTIEWEGPTNRRIYWGY